MGNNVNYSAVQELLNYVWPGWKITGIAGKNSNGIIYEIIRNDLGTDFKCSLKVLQMKGDRQGSLLSLEHLSQNTSPSSPENVREADLDKFLDIVNKEIDAMMKLRGVPNIVSIEDYATVRRQRTRTILIRMEALDSLEDYICRCGTLTPQQIIELGTDICTALSHIEKLGILHGNVRADNIFHSDLAGFKLGDFGLSGTVYSVKEERTVAHTRSRTRPGGIVNIAPADPTFDLYSLGLVLEGLLLYSLDDTHTRRALHDVIRTACDPDPARRFQTADSFKSALQQCLYTDAAPEIPRKDPGFSRRQLPKFILCASLLLFAAVVCIFFYWRGRSVRENTPGETASAGVSSPLAEEEPSFFADPALEYAVRQSAGIPDGEISAETAASITSLNLSGENENKYGKISSLDGLSVFKNLRELDLSDNQISDISELSILQHLKTVCLKNNKVEDISPLAALPELEELDFSINAVSNISSLGKLTDLVYLNAGSNNISDIRCLENLAGLKELSLDINHITDITPLAGLYNLSRLGLSYNEINEFSSLTGLKNLSFLNLKGNNIKDLRGVSGLSFLEYLDISDNGIGDESPLDSLPDTMTVVTDKTADN